MPKFPPLKLTKDERKVSSIMTTCLTFTILTQRPIVRAFLTPQRRYETSSTHKFVYINLSSLPYFIHISSPIPPHLQILISAIKSQIRKILYTPYHILHNPTPDQPPTVANKRTQNPRRLIARLGKGTHTSYACHSHFSTFNRQHTLASPVPQSLDPAKGEQ